MQRFRAISIVIISLLLAASAFAQRGSFLPPFVGTLTRLSGSTVSTRVPFALTPEATSQEQPNFEIYTKDSIGDDHGRISPAFVIGYKNDRVGTLPWAVESGYKYVDTATGHLDVLIGSGWIRPWAAGSETSNQSLTIEEDASDVRSNQVRFDSYAIGEVVRGMVTIDLLAGVTTARVAGTGRTTALLTGVLPSVQVSKLYSLQAFYAPKNDVDGEDYWEGGIARAFERPEFQVSLVAAKHGTYAVRFQKTLKKFTRPAAR